MVVVTKVLAALVVAAITARVLVRRDSELARRFRLFVDVSLIVIGVVYGARLLQQWL